MSQLFNSFYYQAYSASLNERVNSLLTLLNDKKRIISLQFFGASTEERYSEDLIEIKKVVDAIFIEQSPLVSYIIQPLYDTDAMAVEVYSIPENASPVSVDFKIHNDVRYALYTHNNSTFLITEGILGHSIYDSITTQASDIFDKIESILAYEQLDINYIVRQWNYIGHITDTENGLQNYQAFNDARSLFYKGAKWNHGYPAATGIGMECRGVVVSLIAMTNPIEGQIVPINNPLQVPAFAYSESLLIGRQTEMTTKATPKFERAKVIATEAGAVCFISGTAAIRGEMSMKEMSAGLQTTQTIENILHLISPQNLIRQGVTATNANVKVSSLRVYIKHKEDFDAVKAEVEKIWSQLPVIYLQAGICRKELLVEIEGIAMKFE